MKSESGFSLAMASQPFLHPLSDSHHLARDSLEPVKNSPGGSIIVRRTFFFDILHAFPTKPFEDPSLFWSQPMESTQHLLCCQKVGWSSLSLLFLPTRCIYDDTPFHTTWPDPKQTIKSPIERLPLCRISDSDWPPRGRIDSKWYSSTSIMEEAIVLF